MVSAWLAEIDKYIRGVLMSKSQRDERVVDDGWCG